MQCKSCYTRTNCTVGDSVDLDLSPSQKAQFEKADVPRVTKAEGLRRSFGTRGFESFPSLCGSYPGKVR